MPGKYTKKNSRARQNTLRRYCPLWMRFSKMREYSEMGIVHKGEGC